MTKILPRILSISDIHLGHPKVSTQSLTERLVKYVFPKLPETDLLVISGDLYHTLLHMSAQDTRLATAFVIKLLNECNKYGVVVRILRGTYTHDRDQSKLIETLFTEYDFTNDLKYFDTLTVERIESLDLKMLYIPDDLGYDSSQDVLDKIHEILTHVGWNTVDIVSGHGYFKHVLPPGIPRPPKITFEAEQFEDIVTGYILMGHVHTGSVKGNIIYNGSFDRLAHGEEESKGFFYINRNIKFIENKDATNFTTIDLSSTPFEHKDEIIEKYCSDVEYRFGDYKVGHVRLVHPETEIRQILAKVTDTKYPDLKYTHKGTKKTEQDTLADSPIVADYTEVNITEDNLPTMVHQFLAENNIQTELDIESINQLLIAI